MEIEPCTLYFRCCVAARCTKTWILFVVGALGKVPLGPGDQKASDEENLKVGDAKVNCGVAMECGDSAFSVHLYTGRENTDMAKMCVNGK